jgi:arsenite methyltransferase
LRERDKPERRLHYDAAGFADVEVTFTHAVADGLHGAIVRATKPPQSSG